MGPEARPPFLRALRLDFPFSLRAFFRATVISLLMHAIAVLQRYEPVRPYVKKKSGQPTAYMTVRASATSLWPPVIRRCHALPGRAFHFRFTVCAHTRLK